MVLEDQIKQLDSLERTELSMHIEEKYAKKNPTYTRLEYLRHRFDEHVVGNAGGRLNELIDILIEKEKNDARRTPEKSGEGLPPY